MPVTLAIQKTEARKALVQSLPEHFDKAFYQIFK